MHNMNLREDTDTLVWEELHPNVIVYRGMLNNPEKAYEIMMRSESANDEKHFFKKWDAWAKFGTYTQAKDPNEQSVSEKDEIYLQEQSLYNEIAISYDRAISHYFKHTGIEIPEGGRYSGQSWCKYFNQIDVMKNNMTMQYHVDYITSQKEMPGTKFHTTCTFYINDNYNGGEIEFYIDGTIITHKPQAGDLVIFPSVEPYWHGVKTIPDGNKFFIRNFVVYDYPGSKEWLDNQIRYGAYRWAKMEMERIDNEDPRNMLYLKFGNVIPYEEARETEQSEM